MTTADVDEGKAERAGSGRLMSIDAYRGFVMLAMASAGLGLTALARTRSLGYWNDLLVDQTDHVAWRGCTFWDLIQPSFMFLVGVSLPFSDAARKARGDSWGRRLLHTIWRSAILIVLGVFLSSNGAARTNFTFVNVLTQIGLGYTFVFLILGLRPAWQLAIAVLILAGYGAFFLRYPAPSHNEAMRMVPTDWQLLRDPPTHWEKHTNAAAAFDRWFLNKFPRVNGKNEVVPFVVNDGGYQTLNFIPSMATMIFGVLAGRWLRSGATKARKAGMLLLTGAFCMMLGTALDVTVCPIIKRIWTPSWTIYSTAWTCWFLGAFYGVIEVWGWRRWAFPLVVVGMNSIAIYVMSQLMSGWIQDTLKAHIGTAVYWVNPEHARRSIASSSTPRVAREPDRPAAASPRMATQRAPAGPRGAADIARQIPAPPPERSNDFLPGPYGPMAGRAAVLVVLWLICFWMYRRRIFLKI